MAKVLILSVPWPFLILKINYLYPYSIELVLIITVSCHFLVQHCKSSFIEIGHSVRFVGLSGDHLTLSVCYENGNKKVMALFDVPTLWSTVS